MKDVVEFLSDVKYPKVFKGSVGRVCEECEKVAEYKFALVYDSEFDKTDLCDVLCDVMEFLLGKKGFAEFLLAVREI